MADVFISYSRKDKAFVEQLASALSERGKDVWVDWEDILPSAEWEREIFAGIDASDAFLFVITPESLTSEVCGREVGHAVEQRKRIVPLVLREPDGSPVPGALAERNWIFFRPGDDFGGSLATLVDTLETDLDWVRAHTRLLVRAREWKARGDASLLLRGNDLREAEQRLASVGPEEEPQPTPDQREYVLASRRAATRRGRMTMAAVVAVLALTAVLAVLALVQRNEAREQRNEAVRQARIAQSRELAASANAELDVDPEASVVLARRALSVAPTPEAVIALRTALSRSHVTALMTGHTAWIRDGDLSPDGSRVATASDDGTARIWDAESGEALAVLADHRRSVRSVEFSSDGRLLLTGASDGKARIWNVATGEAVTVLRGTKGVVRADLDPAGRRVATAGSDGNGAVWAAASGRRLATLRGHTARVNRILFTTDGERIVTAADDGTVRVWDARSGRALHVLEAVTTPAGGQAVLALSVSRDGRLVAGGGTGGGVRVWRTASGTTVRTVEPGSGIVAGLAFSPGGDRLAIGTEAGAAVWDLATGTAAAVLKGHTAAVTRIAFDRRGERLVTAGADGTARLWDATTGEALAEFTGHDGWVSGAEFSQRGDRVLTYAQDGTARVWAADVGGPRHVLVEGADPVLAVAFSLDSRSVAAAGLVPVGVWATDTGAERARALYYGSDVELEPDGRHAVLAAGLFGVVRVGAETGEAAPLLQGPGQVMEVELSTDGRLVAAGTAEGTAYVVPVGGGPVVELRGHTAALRDVAFDPAGEQVATASDDKTARVWDAETGRELVALGGLRARVADVAFSPDGRLVATTAGRSARVWDAASGRPGVTLRGHSNIVHAVEFDPDGRRLVTASGDNTARLWDVRSGRVVLVLRGHTAAVVVARFDPAGRHVLTAAWDGTARVWDAETGEAVAVFRGREQTVYDARFAPDGRHVAVAAIGVESPGNVRDVAEAFALAGRGEARLAGAARVYECILCGSPDELVRIAEARIARKLTVAARARSS